MNMETIRNSECNARPENRRDRGSQLREDEEVGIWFRLNALSGVTELLQEEWDLTIEAVRPV
jgi:hypothetical protein